MGGDCGGDPKKDRGRGGVKIVAEEEEIAVMILVKEEETKA